MRGRRLERSNLLTSITLVLPLFLIYQLGVLVVPDVHNGADLVTGRLLALLNGRIGIYILVNLAVALAFVVLLLLARRRDALDTRLFLPVLVESGIYAVTMGTLICVVMQDVLHVDPRLATAGPEAVGPLAKIILALGAGVHEELLFRLLILGGLLWGGQKLIGLPKAGALALAFIVSSLLFSAAHHIIGGEPWRLGAFVYRFLCGLFFATLFQTRGFAVAVYTHALYDVYVLLLRG
jgi:hypothetical protein